MLHLHPIKSQASPYWDSLVRVYHASFPIDEQRPIASIVHLIEHDERFVAYAIIDEDENENEDENVDDTPSAPLVPFKEGQCPTRYTLNSRQDNISHPSRFVLASENQTCLNFPSERSQSSTTKLLTQRPPIGLLTTWHFEKFIYIEHFAITPTLRSQGYGSEALRAFISQQQCPIVLEAEPPTDEFSTRRIGFYERSGLTLYDFPYIQPAYTPESNPVELRLMGTLDITTTPLTHVAQILYHEVYKCDTTSRPLKLTNRLR